MLKRIATILLALAMVFSLVALTACGDKKTDGGDEGEEAIKVGFIFIGDENETYTHAHYVGVLAMQEELGLKDDQIIIKWSVPEGQEAYDAAIDLVESGCSVIFANSFGHEDFVKQAAEENPDVQFCHSSGYQALSAGLDNFHNYFSDIYEARYLAGVVAGYKLKYLVDAGELTEDQLKIGYVGAYSYSEVISGMTAFYLGVRSVCPTATMVVKYTGSWADQALEKETAEALIAEDCVLISQHADTTGAATACESAGAYDVGYNASMLEAAPNYAVTSAVPIWGPYYTYAVKCVMDGEKIATDWTSGVGDGACDISEINSTIFTEEQFAEVQAKVEEVKAGLADGSIKVFDLSTFTVNGEELAAGTLDGNGNDQIKDGAFMESSVQSAPGFNWIIDGITELNQVY